MDKEVKYAGFWVRVLANILDCALLIAGLYVLRFFFPVGVSIPDFSGALEIEDFSQISRIFNLIWKSAIAVNMVNIIGAVALIIYSVVMLGVFGATLGKMAVGIRVVREDLRPVSFGIAFLREMLIKDILFLVICFISWLGYLWIAWDPRKQGWHDKITRTLVIKEYP